MSTSHYACTFSFDPSLVGDDAAVRAQGALFVEEGRGLETDSRGGWFLWTLGRMAADLHPQALRFLDEKSGVTFQDARGAAWRLSTLTRVRDSSSCQRRPRSWTQTDTAPMCL